MIVNVFDFYDKFYDLFWFELEWIEVGKLYNGWNLLNLNNWIFLSE